MYIDQDTTKPTQILSYVLRVFKLEKHVRETDTPHVLSRNSGTSPRLFEFLYGVEIRLYRSKIVLSPRASGARAGVLMTARGVGSTYLHLHMPRQPHFILRLAACLPTLLQHHGLFFSYYSNVHYFLFDRRRYLQYHGVSHNV